MLSVKCCSLTKLSDTFLGVIDRVDEASQKRSVLRPSPWFTKKQTDASDLIKNPWVHPPPPTDTDTAATATDDWFPSCVDRVRTELVQITSAVEIKVGVNTFF